MTHSSLKLVMVSTENILGLSIILINIIIKILFISKFTVLS